MNDKIFCLSLLLLTSCGIKSVEESNIKAVPAVTKYYADFVKENVTKKPNSDTIALGFILGQSEKEVDKHYELLKKQGKIGHLTIWKNKITDLQGHAYELAISNYNICNTLIGNTFYKGKMATMSIFGTTNSSIDSIVKFIEKKSGKYALKTISGSEASYFWFDGYKEIAVREAPIVDFVIEYTDLRLRFEEKADIKRKDSIERIKNIEKSKQAIEDFK